MEDCEDFAVVKDAKWPYVCKSIPDSCFETEQLVTFTLVNLFGTRHVIFDIQKRDI